MIRKMDTFSLLNFIFELLMFLISQIFKLLKVAHNMSGLHLWLDLSHNMTELHLWLDLSFPSITWKSTYEKKKKQTMSKYFPRRKTKCWNILKLLPKSLNRQFILRLKLYNSKKACPRSIRSQILIWHQSDSRGRIKIEVITCFWTRNVSA